MASPSEVTPRGVRLVTLRQLEGLTQADLGKALRVSGAFVSQVEKGKPLPIDVMRRACEKFDLPSSFFTTAPDITEIGVATFRKSSKASVRDEAHVVALFGEASRFFRMISEASGYRTADLAGLSDLDEEEAASQLRTALRLDTTEPIPNATRALERLGIGVIHVLDPLEDSRRDHDGISRPHSLNDRPLISTVGHQPPAVARMTVLHELGHLIYDRTLAAPITSRRSLEERRAYRLAGAMLIPASVVRKRITESMTLHAYLRVKADYGVTVAALIQRASDLGAISAQRKRSLFIQYSSQGWRRNEPVDVAAEQPRLLAQAAFRGIGSRPEAIADATGVPERFVRHWLDIPREEKALAPVLSLEAASRRRQR